MGRASIIGVIGARNRNMQGSIEVHFPTEGRRVVHKYIWLVEIIHNGLDTGNGKVIKHIYPYSERKTMFDMNKSLEEQTEPVLRALLNLHKTEEGRQKIIEILRKHNHEKTGQPTQRRPLKRF